MPITIPFLPFIFLFYGLSFFAMGLAVALEARRSSVLPLYPSLKYLAAFGLSHSFVEWLDMLILLQVQAPEETLLPFRQAKTALLVTSSLCLLFFGVNLIVNSTQKHRWLYAVLLVLPGTWLLSFVLPHMEWIAREQTVMGTGSCVQCHGAQAGNYLVFSSEWLAGADNGARYLLYFPGSILAALAMLSQRRFFRAFGSSRLVHDSTLAAAAFAFNAVIAGLVVAPGLYFPASVVNYATFFNLFRLPPQVFRTLAAFGIAFFILRILRIFEMERQRQLNRANDERLTAQRQLLEAQVAARQQLEQWTLDLEQRIAERTREIEERNRELTILGERDRIAREMHDSLGQTLGFLGIKTVELRQLIAGQRWNQVVDGLHQMEEAIQDASFDVRESILSLRQSVSPEGGLAATLEEYAMDFGDRAGLKVELPKERQTLPSLSPLAEVQILRIVQEALTNVRKHARATKVWLRLETSPKKVKITVEDNGAGFDVERVTQEQRHTFGLATMKERAQEIGATLIVDAASGKGTRVILELLERECDGREGRNDGPAGG
ncbi:MAG: sensor histidine kinase [Chloroflexi bacterium]|nr:sensor histidine kinase [Chloroflexota bacterium]